MCWQAEAWRDMDRIRSQLREDFQASREGRPPWPVRVAVWGGLVAAGAATDALAAVVPAGLVFEAFVAPRLSPRRPATIGPLRPWNPPESYRESPEAPAPWALDQR
jgi:hypothetical protein